MGHYDQSYILEVLVLELGAGKDWEKEWQSLGFVCLLKAK